MNWQRNRHVIERWFVEGKLELTTPASLSNGDDDPLVDLPIVVDALDGSALLTGSSLAGALRSYLEDFDPGSAVALFGGNRRDRDGAQSPLIVDDALGGKPVIELREGVAIDPTTRTSKEDQLYDRQLLRAGTTFDLSFELIVAENPYAEPEELARQRAANEKMKAGLARALEGLQRGDIRLGGRKRRGYGQCEVTEWRAWRYKLDDRAQVQAWLAHGRGDFPGYETPQWTWTASDGGAGIRGWNALAGAPDLSRLHKPFTLSATFNIDGAVLIRSGFEAESGPDVMHLESYRPEMKKAMPVMSGTSLAGVIRAQAARIARTVAGSDGKTVAEDFVNEMFGVMGQPKKTMTPEERRKLKKRASRVTIDESVIDGSKAIVQTRVKIDRFTGGAFESALFGEQPAFGGKFTMELALRPPPAPKSIDKPPAEMTPEEKAQAAANMKAHKAKQDAEAGLLLLVLKDLWTGFLPVGGSSSIGRGRLKGKEATIVVDGETWALKANGDGLKVTPPNGQAATKLNDYVTAFKAAMEGK